jgi:Xaa-Pro aminopeptidase
VKALLEKYNIDYLLVNSTNEFLMEYTPLEENDRYALTGFSGSTGDALLSREELLLFVDGRYHIQADQEVFEGVEVVKLQAGQLFLDELAARIKPGATLGVFARKNTQARVETLEKKGVNVKLIVDKTQLSTRRLDRRNPQLVNLSNHLTGLSTEEKAAQIKENLLVTNLEEVSYLFNIRDFSRPYTCAVKAKAVVIDAKARLFTDMSEFEEFVKSFDDVLWVDKTTISAYDYGLCKQPRELKDSPVKLMKSVKTDAEIEHYKDAFRRTDATMLAIRDFIEQNDELSEYDISQRLEEEFFKHGAKSLSFRPIVAVDKNSALAHYSKASKDVILQEGGLVLIDCGAYYEGGLATDITRVFVKGEPSDLQKQVYTTILKAFESANGSTGYEIDNNVREFFAQNPIAGFEFTHGLGHGIGINVHECPPSLSKHELAKTEIKDNMCFSIEPGLYNAEHFGVRLENVCYYKDGQIISFANAPFEGKLIWK